jgi:hypothetical protein
MRAESPTRSSPVLRRLCWLPLATLLAIELYLRNFDGWGAWASAPLLLLPAFVALPLVVIGISEWRKARRAGQPAGSTVILVLIAALPILWLPIRRYFL